MHVVLAALWLIQFIFETDWGSGFVSGAGLLTGAYIIVLIIYPSLFTRAPVLDAFGLVVIVLVVVERFTNLTIPRFGEVSLVGLLQTYVFGGFLQYFPGPIANLARAASDRLQPYNVASYDDLPPAALSCFLEDTTSMGIMLLGVALLLGMQSWLVAAISAAYQLIVYAAAGLFAYASVTAGGLQDKVGDLERAENSRSATEAATAGTTRAERAARIVAARRLHRWFTGAADVPRRPGFNAAHQADAIVAGLRFRGRRPQTPLAAEAGYAGVRFPRPPPPPPPAPPAAPSRRKPSDKMS